MSVELLTEHHLEFLRLKGGCIGSSESTLVKIPHCWKSHAAVHFVIKGYVNKLTCRKLKLGCSCNVILANTSTTLNSTRKWVLRISLSVSLSLSLV